MKPEQTKIELTRLQTYMDRLKQQLTNEARPAMREFLERDLKRTQARIERLR